MDIIYETKEGQKTLNEIVATERMAQNKVQEVLDKVELFNRDTIWKVANLLLTMTRQQTERFEAQERERARVFTEVVKLGEILIPSDTPVEKANSKKCACSLCAVRISADYGPWCDVCVLRCDEKPTGFYKKIKALVNHYSMWIGRYTTGVTVKTGGYKIGAVHASRKS